MREQIVTTLCRLLAVYSTFALAAIADDIGRDGYVPSGTITPIAAMPAEHPAVKDELCGTKLEAGGPIPVKGLGLFNRDLNCTEYKGAELFYGFG